MVSRAAIDDDKFEGFEVKPVSIKKRAKRRSVQRDDEPVDGYGVTDEYAMDDAGYGQDEDISEEILELQIMEFLEAGNIASELPEDAAQRIMEGYSDAHNSMADWLRKYDDAMRLGKMEPREKNKTFPFKNASTAMSSFVLEAMIDFNARSAPELAYSDNIVKTKVYGNSDVPPPPTAPEEAGIQDDPRAAEAYKIAEEGYQDQISRIDEEKEDRGDRVSEYCNYQLSELMPSWKQEQDKNLLSLPCIGTMYKCTYFNYDEQEVCSDLYYGDEVVFHQDYKTFEAAPDKYIKLPPMTRNEVIQCIRGDEEWDIDEADLSDDSRETYKFTKAYTWFDADEDGLDEPYCAIVWDDQQKVVYARPLFDEETITVNDEGDVAKVEAIDVFTQYQFIPDPEGGPMGMGWGILLGPHFKEINMTIRKQMDAGTLQVVAGNSGFYAPGLSTSRGNRTKRGPLDVKMGQLTAVETGGSSLRDSIMQFPSVGPSPVMHQLMEYLVTAGQRLTDASSQAEANPNEAASLYLARLSQTLKRPNVIIMRVYNCAKKEFRKIAALNHKHYSNKKYNSVIDRPKEYSMEDDFNPGDCDIVLVADPSQGSDMERIARSEAVLQNAKTEQTPITDMRQATISYYKVLGVQDLDTLVPPAPEGPDPIQQQLMAQQQMEAEFKNRELRVQEQRIEMEENKATMNAQNEEMKLMLQGLSAEVDANLSAEERISKIMLNIANAAEKLSKTEPGALAAVAAIETQFIDEPGVINDRQIPDSNIGPARNLGIPPSDQDASPFA